MIFENRRSFIDLFSSQLKISCKCWNIETGKELFCVDKHTSKFDNFNLIRQEKNYFQKDQAVTVQFNHDGTKMIAASADHNISITDFKTRETIFSNKLPSLNYVFYIAFHKFFCVRFNLWIMHA